MRIPVVWSGGQWRLQGDVAGDFKEGTAGVLHVDGLEVTDRKSRKGAVQKRKVFALPVRTELRVALTIKSDLDAFLRQFLVQENTDVDVTAQISDQTRFVSVRLRGAGQPDLVPDVEPGALWFVFRGRKLRGIELGVVELPSGLDLPPAISLNHAFTRLSEVFEPWRMAHTGNIYERVFYKESDRRWGPLKELRDRAIVEGRAAVATN